MPEPESRVIHGSYDGSGFDSGVGLLRNRFDLFNDVPKGVITCFPPTRHWRMQD